MAIRIGSNPLSLGLQSSLNKTDATLSKTSERLSSGLRINRGSDDAAGLSISQSLNLNAKVYSQGVRNLNDGLSAVNIADGAIDGLNTILSRIEELAMQSANGTLSDTQRTVMQQEVTALQAEWNRIVDTTTFNGQQLLTGSTTRMVLQGGTQNTGTLAVQVGKEALAGGFDNYAGGTSLVSTSSAGVQGTNSSDGVAISADGRYVAFNSNSSNLVSGDSNGATDVFLRDTLTGVVVRVSTSSSGAQSNGGSSVAGISGDGRYVVFQSGASNLVSGDTNGATDVFVKDTITGVTTRVSTSSSGNQAVGFTYMQACGISTDGRYVLFYTDDNNLAPGDNNSTGATSYFSCDVFLKDTLTGVTTRVSTSSSGEGAYYNSAYGGAISADGRYVTFHSRADNLVANDTNYGEDVFLKDTKTGVTTRVSTSSAGGQSNHMSYVKAISADGRFVAFDSLADNLVTGDTNGTLDAFIKDTITGVTTRVSTSSSGGQSSGGSYVHAISADGRFVTFASDASNLVSGDNNGARDIFVKDTLTGVTTLVSTSSSGQQGVGAPVSASISADGRYIAFASDATNLVSGDTNGASDIFLRDLTKAGVQTLAGMVVNNKASAVVTMNLVQNYRNELIDCRGKLGASTSRLTTYMSSLNTGKLNLSAASSVITDADVASESATFVAASTRRQSASSLLAQANLVPEVALALLRTL